MLWNFTLHLKGIGEFSDDLAETLKSILQMALLASSDGQARISMGREATMLNDAIRSAVSDLRRHGLDVDHVEIEEEDLAEKELAQWRTA